MIARVKTEIREFLSPLRPVPTTVFLVAGLMMCVHHYYGQGKFFRRVVGPALDLSRGEISYFACLYWPLTALVTYLLLPHLALRAASRFDPEEGPVYRAGLGLGDWRFGLRVAAFFYAVMVPLLLVVIWNGDFQGKYPLCGAATTSLQRFVVYELGFATYFIAWEYFFRGFLLFGLKRTFGHWTIWVQMLPFVVIHFPKPDLEAISSIIGGLALGWLALRTRSIWYGWFVHAATAVTLECLVVLIEGGLGTA